MIEQTRAADVDRAALRDFQSVAASQQRALARAAGPDHHHDLRGANAEIDPAQNLVIPEGLVQVANVDHGVHWTIPPARNRRSTSRNAPAVAEVSTR